MTTGPTYLITGGCGFIGSNLVRHILSERPDATVVNYDALTYAGNLMNLEGLPPDEERRMVFIKADVTDAPNVRAAFYKHRPSVVFHLAAESHVDRSLSDPAPFIRTNVAGTQVMLAAAREFAVSRFVMVSTDEVYGSLGPEGSFTESSPLAPNSPYAASKAGADLLCRAAHHSFGLDVVITRCSNNYGPYQFPEKLIPLMVTNAMMNVPLPVYGDGLNVRDWLHVSDHCRGLMLAAERGRAGEVYNLGGRNEIRNLDLVKRILGIMRKPGSLIRFVEDRAGHDRRYAIDPSKAERDLGWRAETDFDAALDETLGWYQRNPGWLSGITTGEYRRFYETQYLPRRLGS